MTYSISKDILQSQCGLGYSFRRPLVRSLARNFNRIKVAFQGLGGGEALLNRQIVIFNGEVDITEHVRLCLDFSIHFVKFVDRIPGHSGFPSQGDENFQISGHKHIFSRFLLRGLAHTL